MQKAGRIVKKLILNKTRKYKKKESRKTAMSVTELV